MTLKIMNETCDARCSLIVHDPLTWFKHLSDGQNIFRDCKSQNLAIFGGAISSWIKDSKTNEVHRWILHIVMTSGKLQNPHFMDLQNFPQATNTSNKWPQPNKLIQFRTETSCKNSTCGFPLLGCKSKSSFHFVWTFFFCHVCFRRKEYAHLHFLMIP